MTEISRRPIRLAVLLTHPVQYMAPWFRHIAEHCPELDLTVIYATEPTPEQQGTGFGRAFTWDQPLTEGYPCQVVRPARPGDDVASGACRGLDVPEATAALLAAKPDVALIPGWHSVTYVRAIAACHRAGIPVLYRGDTHLGQAPRGWRRPLWELHTRRRLAPYAAFLAVGRRSREYLAHFGVPADRIFHSPHAADNAFFADLVAPHGSPEGKAAARRALGLPEEAFVPLFVGKLEGIKRPGDLIAAAGRLGPGTHLLMVGEGPLAEACREQAEAAGVLGVWTGFLNQSELGRAYGAADCLVLPSTAETWGLVVNEALAAGLPAVVSDGVGAGVDLIEPGVTGEIVPVGDVPALALALEAVAARFRAGGSHTWTAPCQRRARQHSFTQATEGLLAACLGVLGRECVLGRGEVSESRPGSGEDGRLRERRVLACCSGMVVVAGLEIQTFEVIRTLTGAGARVRCLLNDWENHRIRPLAERAGAEWAILPDRGKLTWRTLHPLHWASMLWNMGRTSLALLREARALHPTHILVPELGAALRSAPALAWLRFRGIPVIFRAGNAPERGRPHEILWRWVLPRLIDLFVANSGFGQRRLLETGLPEDRVRRIHNAVAARSPEEPGAGGSLDATDDEIRTLASRRPTLVTVGQIAPFKGTHLAVEAALELLGEGRDLQALIVGRIPEWPPAYAAYARDLRRRVLEEGFGDRVLFVGERVDVPGILLRSALLVAPILQEETFGNVVLEAREAGLPAVTFPRGGLPELVEHGVTGYLCPEATREALLAGIRSFLDSPERLQAARAACQEELPEGSPYSRQTFSEAWISLLETEEGTP